MALRRPGDLLAARYRLDDLISESGAGWVWRGYDTVLARAVTIHALDADDPRGSALIEAAQASARLTDVRILKVLDIDSRDGTLFVVNEWGEGQSIDHLVMREGPLPPRKAAWLVEEVAAALTGAHEAGVAHGRLNPENVLIDIGGSVRLIGFGIDAVLHDLPGDRIGIDVVDLAALLQVALTGRWAGLSDSAVPRVPREEGSLLDRSRVHFLTPRQLQPGVPRVLDDLCAEVLNRPHGRHAGPNSAREIHQVLSAFVGNPGLVEEELAETLVRSPIPFVGAATPSAESHPLRATGDTPGSGTDPAGTEPLKLTDLPTQAGTPIFSETGEVDWFSPRGGRPAPPPPLEPLPDRPLFAEGPGRSALTGAEPPTAVGPAAETSADWIFSTPAGIEDDSSAGSPLLRWGLGLGLVAVLVVGLVLALTLTTKDPATPPSATTPSATTPAAPALITGASILDFDPLSTPPTENRDLVELAMDGKTSTSWRSSTYFQQFGPRGLKTGLGLVVDLKKSYSVTGVNLTFDRPGTTASFFVSDTAPSGDPTTLPGWEPLQSLTMDTTKELTFMTPASGRFLTLWFTGLPQVKGGFRAGVAEVGVLGRPAPSD